MTIWIYFVVTSYRTLFYCKYNPLFHRHKLTQKRLQLKGDIQTYSCWATRVQHDYHGASSTVPRNGQTHATCQFYFFKNSNFAKNR